MATKGEDVAVSIYVADEVDGPSAVLRDAGAKNVVVRGGSNRGVVELIKGDESILASDCVVAGLGDVVACVETEGRAVAVGEAENGLADGQQRVCVREQKRLPQICGTSRRAWPGPWRPRRACAHLAQRGRH